MSSIMYNQFIQTFPSLIRELSIAKQQANTSFQLIVEERLRSHYTNLITNNNISWVNGREYMSVFRHRINEKLYCYTLHDNNQNVISNHMQSTDGSPIINDNNFKLVLGGPDFSDTLQTAHDFASFVIGV